MTPDNYTIEEFYLESQDGHEIYVHDWGNKKAKHLIMHLHGGPGNGSSDYDKVKFDPLIQRVIFFDQRGSGKSLPYGSLANNTTPHLINDMNRIIKKLGFSKVILVGGSWGSALALYYGALNPDKVSAMIIDGVLSVSSEEKNWYEKCLWRYFYPEVYDYLLTLLPAKYKHRPLEYFIDGAGSGDSKKAKQAAYEYLNIHLALLSLDDNYINPNYEEFDPCHGLIELHYLKSDYYIGENYIINHAHNLTMPIYMIQGRYDMLTPPYGAYNLSKKLPQAKYISTINGHRKMHESRNILKLVLSNLTT